MDGFFPVVEHAPTVVPEPMEAVDGVIAAADGVIAAARGVTPEVIDLTMEDSDSDDELSDTASDLSSDSDSDSGSDGDGDTDIDNEGVIDDAESVILDQTGHLTLSEQQLFNIHTEEDDIREEMDAAIDDLVQSTILMKYDNLANPPRLQSQDASSPISMMHLPLQRSVRSIARFIEAVNNYYFLMRSTRKCVPVTMHMCADRVVWAVGGGRQFHLHRYDGQYKPKNYLYLPLVGEGLPWIYNIPETLIKQALILNDLGVGVSGFVFVDNDIITIALPFAFCNGPLLDHLYDEGLIH